MKIRDIIALPFLFLSLLFETIAIKIGGKWTSKTILYSFRVTNSVINRK